MKLVQGIEPYVFKASKMFNELKQDCFYVSQRKGKLFSISNNLSLKEQEKLAFWIKEHSESLFLGSVLYFDTQTKLKLLIKHNKKFEDEKYYEKHYDGYDIFEKYYWKE